MADVGLQAVDGQDDAALRGQQPAQAAGVGQGDGQQFVVALQEVGDRPLGDGQAPGDQVLVDLGDGAVLGVAEGAEVGDDVQAELVLGQGVAALGLGPVGLQVAWAVGGVAAADVEHQPCQAQQGDDGAVVPVVGPHPSVAGGAVLVQGVQVLGEGGFGAGRLPGHGKLLGWGALLRNSFFAVRLGNVP